MLPPRQNINERLMSLKTATTLYQLGMGIWNHHHHHHHHHHHIPNTQWVPNAQRVSIAYPYYQCLLVSPGPVCKNWFELKIWNNIKMFPFTGQLHHYLVWISPNLNTKIWISHKNCIYNEPCFYQCQHSHNTIIPNNHVTLFFPFFFLKEKLLLHKAKTEHQQEQNRGRQGGHTNPKQKENNKTT